LNSLEPLINNEQLSDSVINIPEPLLSIPIPVSGMRFESWTEIDRYIDVYCNSKNFSKVIYGAEYDNGVRRCCRYKCEYQGNYQGKKKMMIVENQRNTHSKRSGCPWFINATCPKTTGIISITTLSLEHGDHPLDPLTSKFGLTHRTLTEPMLADIEFWTTKGNLNMRTQRQLLEAKYENVFFLSQDLSNAIQKVKTEQKVDHEAATLVNHLIERKAKDIRWTINWCVDPATNTLVSIFWMTPEQYELYLQYSDVVQYDNTYSTNKFKMALGLFVIVDNHNRSRLVGQTLITDETLESFEWVFNSLNKGTNVFPSVIIIDNDLAIDAAIANIMPDTFHVHCIYHIGQNLLKNLKSKLGLEYNDFIKAWYKMRNTVSQTEFDYLWDSLLEQYPASESYLNRALGSQKHKWAFSYISRIFTGGIQSTQRVEGQNAIIKSAINSHTSLLDLFKKIEIQLNRVSTTIQYKNWVHSVTGSMLIHSSHDFSPIIDKWIVDYLTPAALSMQRQEIAQAVWYVTPFIWAAINKNQADLFHKSV